MKVSDTAEATCRESLGKQVDASHYAFARYMDKARWASVWHQMDEILQCRPRSVLEIGKGAGLLGVLLKHYGIAYHSVDIDPELEPDFVASVHDLPFGVASYDVVTCFQVLEHLPYDQFEPAVRELLRVATHRVVLSLPDAQILWCYRIYVPKIGNVELDLPRPRLRLRKHVFDGQHFWEINKAGYPLSRITGSLKSCGANVERTFRVPDNPYHRFFVVSPGGTEA